VSAVTIPRPVAAPPRRTAAPTPLTRVPTREAAHSRVARPSSARRSVVIVVVALALSISGSMLAANRQVQIHQLQSQLLQLQSNYAQQVGALTNLAAPGQIAEQAGVLHLVDPVSVTQVPSTSLDAPLPLPKFLGSAPVTSRTRR
jgi:uncharacterized protein HemX